jgi:hypothetical protein
VNDNGHFLKSKGTLEKGQRKTVCRHLVIQSAQQKTLSASWLQRSRDLMAHDNGWAVHEESVSAGMFCEYLVLALQNSQPALFLKVAKSKHKK